MTPIFTSCVFKNTVNRSNHVCDPLTTPSDTPNQPPTSPTSPKPANECGKLTTPPRVVFDTEKRKRIEKAIKDLSALCTCDLDDCINRVTEKRKRRWLADWRAKWYTE